MCDLGKGRAKKTKMLMIILDKTTAKAIEFYNDKAKELETNLKDLEKIVQGKSANLRIVEDGTLLSLIFRGHIFVFLDDVTHVDAFQEVT